MNVRFARRLVPAVAVLVPTLTLACSYDQVDQMSESQYFSVFQQSPNRVVDALTAELVSRNALSGEVADELEAGVLSRFGAGGQAILNSESVALGAQELAGLVPEEFRHFIGDEGGRYVLEFRLATAADGGLRLSVVPTIIATVGGGEGPLGGRPLPSNGSLERSILDSLSRRLGV